MRKGFMLFHDLAEVLIALGDEKSGKLIKAMIQYSTDGIVPELESPLDIVFIQLRQQLDRDIERYDHICERNRENIKKRWDTKNTSRISGVPEYTKNTNTNTNTKTNTNRIPKERYLSGTDELPTNEDIISLSRKFSIPASTVAAYKQSYLDWVLGNEKYKYGRHMAATVSNWLRRDLKEGKIHKTQEAQIKEMYGLS